MMSVRHRYVAIGATVTVYVALGGVPSPARGQVAPTPALGIDVGAQGGVLGSWNGAGRSDRASAAPLFGILRAGVSIHQDAGLFAVDGALDITSASVMGAHMTQPLGRLHVATQRGLVTLSVGIEQNVGAVIQQPRTGAPPSAGTGDTLGTYDPGSSPFGQAGPAGTRLVRVMDAVGGIGWHGHFAGLHMVGLGGVRLNELRHGAWLGGDVSVDVGATSMLTLAMRYQSPNAAIRMPAVALGVRTAYWRWGNHGVPDTTHRAGVAPSARVTVVGDTVRLALQLQGAHSVALMGDATEWQPVLMARDSAGWWNTSLCVHDAVSRVQLRVDGSAWRPVPGLPAVRDEYGAMVSLLGGVSK